MSKAQRKAFVLGILLERIGDSALLGEKALEQVALRRYPDKSLGNVREIVIAALKDNGYDGLWFQSIDGNCQCKLPKLQACIEDSCRPGVLVDGKIKEREK